MGEGEETRSASPAPAADGTDTGGKNIDLKLLSPSPDVPASGLFFENIPVSTTLGQLRTRITNALPSRPPPARQRLIYFGRVLQRDDDTLGSVFGDNNIQAQRQHTLHLVLPLREGGSQTPHAPSPVPGPRASIYPPSAIPRPSSVPPRASGSASPFRPAYPLQGQPPQVSAATSAPTISPRPSVGNLRNQAATQEAQQQPQVSAQAQAQTQTQGAVPGQTRLNIQSLLGNANITANITANGQPIDLPPEVVNQLLNQHFLRNGTLDGLLNDAIQQQVRSQQPDSRLPPQATPTVPTPPQRDTNTPGSQLFQQFMASVNQGQGNAPAAGNDTSRQPASDNEQEERGRPRTSNGDVSEPAAAPSTTSNGNSQPPTSTPSHPQRNGPQIHERSGINPDGSRWSIRTATIEGPHIHNHPHNHVHPHGRLPAPQAMQGIPFAMPFPQGFPFPTPPSNMPPGMPIPLAAPVAGLRPHAGTPRSVSPIRSVSEGPAGIRRMGTPAAELQHRLMHTGHEIQHLNNLIGLLANGNMANGAPAPPLAIEQLAQIRQYADSMNAHIEGFGADLERLAQAHPGVRTQPEFAGLSAMFAAVQGQGRGMTQRIEALNVQNPMPAMPADANAINITLDGSSITAQPAATTPDALQQPLRDSSRPPSLSTPTTTSDTLSPSLITRETSPADQPTAAPTISALPAPTAMPHLPSVPTLHLLTDPTNTQHYLLVGPHGASFTGQLPLDVLYPLLATGLPHEQLLNQFNRATTEMARALQRADFRSVLLGAGMPATNLVAARHPSTPSTATTATVAGNANANGAVVAPAAAAGPANANGRQQAGPAQPPAPHRQVQGPAQPRAQQQGREGDPRDVLAPVVRNLWLLVRLCIFGYFFFNSGRGYGRLLLLCALGAIVWGINAGLFGRRVAGLAESVRRHFHDVAAEARGGAGLGAAGGNGGSERGGGNGEGSSRAGGVGTPEEAARRIMVRRAEGQRRRVRDTIRQIERTVALCLASLWPGVGEAVVRSHEQARRDAERAQREAEEARRKQEEEAEEEKRKKNEEKIAELGFTLEEAGMSSGADVGGSADAVDSVNKGKGKAKAKDETSVGDLD